MVEYASPLMVKIVLFVCGCVQMLVAQPQENVQFEVASVKPSARPDGPLPAPGLRRGGPGTNDPTRIVYRNVLLPGLITEAFEIEAEDVVGPAWLTRTSMFGSDNRFDIEAKLPAPATKAAFHRMLQNLLAQRFGLRVHREKKRVSAYAMITSKGGPKIRESPPLSADVAAETKVDTKVRGADGFPVTPPGYSGVFVNVNPGHTRVKFIRYSLDLFAQWTRVNSRRRGINSTGLKACCYDFYLEYAMPTISAVPEARAAGRTGLTSQIRLRIFLRLYRHNSGSN
jgi:uncharacterized protein (TIGR03435 family)